MSESLKTYDRVLKMQEISKGQQVAQQLGEMAQSQIKAIIQDKSYNKLSAVSNKLASLEKQYMPRDDFGPRQVDFVQEQNNVWRTANAIAYDFLDKSWNFHWDNRLLNRIQKPSIPNPDLKQQSS